MMTQDSLLARYKILHELGRGATGAVYAARDRTTGAGVALKRLDPALLNGSDANFADRFLKHARSARLLRHRNIVETYDAGEAAGTVYVAMELLEGESLRNILDHAPLPIARAIRIVHDVAGALAYAHLEGVVHGGIKPSNIIVLRSGVVKVTDFGIGQAGQAAPLSGARASSLRYKSPEQLRGEPIDHRCDIFSLGALFYEMLTHRPPFEGDSTKEIMPPLPSELNQHVPRALDGIVLSMLAAQPVDRLPGVPILLRDLQRVEEGLGLGSGANAGTDEPTSSVPRAAPEAALQTPAPNRFQDSEPMQAAPAFTADREEFDHRRAMMERESRRERSPRSRPVILAALALALAVFGLGFTGLDYWSPATAPRALHPAAPPPVAEATQEPLAAPTAPQASPLRAVSDGEAKSASSAVLSAPEPIPPQPLAAEPSPSAQTESVADRAPEQPVSAVAAPAQPLPPAVQRTAKVPEQQQPGGTARLLLAVSPGGEIYIDGKHHGTTPPITTFDIEPGMHRIEIRSASRRPYLTYITVQAGDVRRIRHDFNAKPIRPPA